MKYGILLTTVLILLGCDRSEPFFELVNQNAIPNSITLISERSVPGCMRELVLKKDAGVADSLKMWVKSAGFSNFETLHIKQDSIFTCDHPKKYECTMRWDKNNIVLLIVNRFYEPEPCKAIDGVESSY